MLRFILILAVIYFAICVCLYFFQEKLIFFPEKLNSGHRFHFDQPFEEINIRTRDSILLNTLLFKADSSKGVILYLHGNAGSLQSWGEVARVYTQQHYDVWMPDYRGYGKSEGTIDGQQLFFNDMQVIYDQVKKRYTEDRIIVLGYSIGTGPAAKLASSNNPALLILQAPYYSLTDMMRYSYPVIPTFILRYKFETNEYLQHCSMPVIIFHGDADEVIYYGSSLKLKENFKESDTLITLKGQGHNQVTDNPEYQAAIKKILGR